MRRTSHIGLMTAALLAVAGPIAYDFAAAEPVKPSPRTPERLTKAEKKRARKAAQRARLAERSRLGEGQ